MSPSYSFFSDSFNPVQSLPRLLLFVKCFFFFASREFPPRQSSQSPPQHVSFRFPQNSQFILISSSFFPDVFLFCTSLLQYCLTLSLLKLLSIPTLFFPAVLLITNGVLTSNLFFSLFHAESVFSSSSRFLPLRLMTTISISSPYQYSVYRFFFSPLFVHRLSEPTPSSSFFAPFCFLSCGQRASPPPFFSSSIFLFRDSPFAYCPETVFFLWLFVRCMICSTSHSF